MDEKALEAAVRRVRQTNPGLANELKAHVDARQDKTKRLERERDEARAECERLRRQIDWLERNSALKTPKQCSIQDYLNTRELPESSCPASDDGRHGEAWYDGEECSMCGDAALTSDQSDPADAAFGSQPADTSKIDAPIPPLPGHKGRTYLCKDSDGLWYYLNHTRTWQGYQGPVSDPCLAKRREGEPSFTLLGRDPQASGLVHKWAKGRKEIEGNTEKVREAAQIAERMYIYAHGGNPDEYPFPSASYRDPHNDALEKAAQVAKSLEDKGTGTEDFALGWAEACIQMQESLTAMKD